MLCGIVSASACADPIECKAFDFPEFYPRDSASRAWPGRPSVYTGSLDNETKTISQGAV